MSVVQSEINGTHHARTRKYFTNQRIEPFFAAETAMEYLAPTVPTPASTLPHSDMPAIHSARARPALTSACSNPTRELT